LQCQPELAVSPHTNLAVGHADILLRIELVAKNDENDEEVTSVRFVNNH
jgi:hypothetical protein